MKLRHLLAAGAAALALMLGSGAADAQALDRILKEKKIRITAQVDSAPFGILDKDNKPTGSEIETARQLAKDSRKDFTAVRSEVEDKLLDLTKRASVGAQTRIAALEAKVAELQRQKQEAARKPARRPKAKARGA